VAVHQVAHLKAVLFLEVTLSEEFDVEQVSPLLTDVPLFDGVRNIRQVESKLQDHEFVLLVLKRIFFALKPSFNRIYSAHMVRHICCEHTVDHQLTHTCKVWLIKLVRPVVLGVPKHDFETSSDVVTLQDADIVVSNCHWVLNVWKENAVNSRVLKVVANCCCENSQVLIRIEVHLVTQVAMLQNHVHSLAEISCMSLIMVS